MGSIQRTVFQIKYLGGTRHLDSIRAELSENPGSPDSDPVLSPGKYLLSLDSPDSPSTTPRAPHGRPRPGSGGLGLMGPEPFVEPEVDFQPPLGFQDAGGGLPRPAGRRGRGTEGKEALGPTGLGIIRSSAGVPLNCGLILSTDEVHLSLDHRDFSRLTIFVTFARLQGQWAS